MGEGDDARADEDKPMRKYGSRHEVFDLQTAKMTRGGLTKDDLVLSRTGRIVSKKKSLAAAEAYKKWGFAKRTVKIPEKKKRRRKKKTE